MSRGQISRPLASTPTDLSLATVVPYSTVVSTPNG
jgi:hypothetical protein